MTRTTQILSPIAGPQSQAIFVRRSETPTQKRPLTYNPVPLVVTPQEQRDRSAREDRIRQVVSDHQQRREAGELVSDDELIAAHPDLMPELAQQLSRLQLIMAARDQAEPQNVQSIGAFLREAEELIGGAGGLSDAN